MPPDAARETIAMTIRKIIAAVKRAEETMLFALCKLNEIQFAAPWAPRRSRCSGL
jgi:hypothetical protein